MKRHLSYIISAAMFFSAVFTSCDKEKDEEKIMTMTTSISGEVSISLAGTGLVNIDWGDGSISDTYDLYNTLINTASSLSACLKFTHNYSGINTRTIRIYGDNITGLESSLQLTNLDVRKNTALIWLRCRNNQLTSLDVSNNTALILLECSNNQLTNIDVSKNPALALLNCMSNQLTSLDVSNNYAMTELFCNNNQLTSLKMRYNSVLTTLLCSNNKLTSLDMSGSVMLKSLVCQDNQLSAAALDSLFETLHIDVVDRKLINIGVNPGTDHCNPSIATEKGWLVIK